MAVGHVFRFHWKESWQWIFEEKCARQVKVCLEEWVEAEVGIELQTVVCICYVMIILVDDVNISTHQAHCKRRMAWFAPMYKMMNFIA
jgi:hypothetical protein